MKWCRAHSYRGGWRFRAKFRVFRGFLGVLGGGAWVWVAVGGVGLEGVLDWGCAGLGLWELALGFFGFEVIKGGLNGRVCCFNT